MQATVVWANVGAAIFDGLPENIQTAFVCLNPLVTEAVLLLSLKGFKWGKK